MKRRVLICMTMTMSVYVACKWALIDGSLRGDNNRVMLALNGGAYINYKDKVRWSGCEHGPV